MLSPELRPTSFDTFQQESWEAYKARLNLPDDAARLQFFRQVVFDHFEHHNQRYPGFEINSYDFQMEGLTAAEVKAQVRFFGNTAQDLIDWGVQFDEYEERQRRGSPSRRRYLVFEEMWAKKTFPFPPILLDSTDLVDEAQCVYGHPFHLIEGTHRVGYLLRMLERRLISPESMHCFVVLRPVRIEKRNEANQ